MSDLVEFVLRLRDMTAPAFKGLGNTSKNTFGGIDKDIYKTQRGLSDLGKEIRLKVDTSDIQRANTEIQGMSRGLSFMQTTGAMALGNFATQGIMRVAQWGKQQFSDIVGKGMEAGMTEMEMNVLAGKKEGGDLYSGTKGYIANSMFDGGLFGFEKELLGYGEKANGILPLIKQMGDLSFGDMGKMQTLTDVLGKVNQYGHFQQAFMKELATAGGFNPVNELYKATGHKYDPDQITASMYKQAMHLATSPGGAWYKMMEQIMSTPGGQYKKDTTNVSMAKEDWGKALLPIESRLFTAFEPMIDKLPGFLDSMTPAVERFTNGIIDLLPDMQRFGGGLMDLIKPVAGVFGGEEFKGLAQNVLSFSNSLMDIATPAVKTFADDIKTAMGNIGNELGSVADIIYFIKHGNMRTTEGASGMVQGIETMSKWQSVSNFIFPKWLTDIGDKSAANLAKGQNNWMGTKNQVGWTVPLHGAAGSGPGAGYMPGLAGGGSFGVTPKMKLAGAAGSADNSSTADAIVGGGRKVINININAPMYKVDHQTFQTQKESMYDFESRLKEAYLRILNSIPSAY